MAMDSSRPFPLIRNKTLNIGALISKKDKEDKLSRKDKAEEEELLFATVQVPSVLPRVVQIPSKKDGDTTVILLEEIIERNIDKLFFITGIIMLISEVIKQFLLTFIVGGGKYNWWYFPFQLCSIPMYVLLIYPWVKRRMARLSMLCFLMCYTLLSGMMAFADTSGMRYPLVILTVHSYAWHILLILIGTASGIIYLRTERERHRYGDGHQRGTHIHGNLGQVDSDIDHDSTVFSFCTFVYATVIYLSCCLIAELLDHVFDRFGTINMFYINTDYLMQQVVFRELIPFTGNTAAILIYIAATVFGAFILFNIWAFIFKRSAFGR